MTGEQYKVAPMSCSAGVQMSQQTRWSSKHSSSSRDCTFHWSWSLMVRGLDLLQLQSRKPAAMWLQPMGLSSKAMDIRPPLTGEYKIKNFMLSICRKRSNNQKHFSVGSCQLTVNKASSDVCQLRWRNDTRDVKLTDFPNESPTFLQPTLSAPCSAVKIFKTL